MKYTAEQIIAAAEQELQAFKADGEKKRTDYDYEMLGFVRSVVERLQSDFPGIIPHIKSRPVDFRDDRENHF